jgi:hypothetical protein
VRQFRGRRFKSRAASADRLPAEKDSPFGALTTNISEAELMAWQLGAAANVVMRMEAPAPTSAAPSDA